MSFIDLPIIKKAFKHFLSCSIFFYLKALGCLLVLDRGKKKHLLKHNSSTVHPRRQHCSELSSVSVVCLWLISDTYTASQVNSNVFCHRAFAEGCGACYLNAQCNGRAVCLKRTETHFGVCLLVPIPWSASPEKRGERQRVICAFEKRQEVEQVGVVTEEVPAKGLCGASC